MRIVIDFPKMPETCSQAEAVAKTAALSCEQLMPLAYQKISETGLATELHQLSWAVLDFKVTITNKETTEEPKP